jgi:predicted phosphoribosyltransferase/pimeloyl-ACP methyl ester carboxylesterase
MSSRTDVFIGRSQLPGLLAAPEGASAMVIFAHGSGSGRFSPRNLQAAEYLEHSGFTTLLFDLLTEAEAERRGNVFDIGLLASRVVEAIDWARSHSPTLSLGLFGASTGAAAALVAAAQRPDHISAIVSRGGRPDLADPFLGDVKAPTLLIVGERDREVLALNEWARARLTCASKLVVVPGATHLFEEEGTLDLALAAAGDWFAEHLDPPLCFSNRRTAGRALAARVAVTKPDAPVVYALPRGGVPVAVEVARRLGAPLDLLLVRKLGVPWQPELAAGAVVDGEQPDVVLNNEIVSAAGLTEAEIEKGIQAQLAEIERRRALYLPGCRPVSARGRTAILVDDGIATGASMAAAIAAVRRRAPGRIVVATPVASPSAAAMLRGLADEFICLSTPENFAGVGQFYDDFHQLTDEEVVNLMKDFGTPGSVASDGKDH